MLTRDKAKRVVDMTNQEAAAYYVRRAASAHGNGEYARANRLYHSAVLHDASNADARRGLEETNNLPDPPGRAGGPAGSRRLRRYRRPWWKRLSGIR
jgi:ferric-dicitrate binding protein FerR (iron transport regulator)